jgi:hypothetical protein
MRNLEYIKAQHAFGLMHFFFTSKLPVSAARSLPDLQPKAISISIPPTKITTPAIYFPLLNYSI